MDVLIIRLSWLYNVRLRLLEHRLRSFRHKVHFLLLPNLVSSLWRHPTIQLPPPHLLLVYSPIWTPSCLIYSFLSSSPFKKNKKKPNRNYVGRVNCVCLICPSLPQCVPCFLFCFFSESHLQLIKIILFAPVIARCLYRLNWWRAIWMRKYHFYSCASQFALPKTKERDVRKAFEIESGEIWRLCETSYVHFWKKKQKNWKESWRNSMPCEFSKSITEQIHRKKRGAS